MLLLKLGKALGILGVVRKTRQVFMFRQTRIHLDDVDGLGTFMELEVVLQAGQSVHDGTTIAKHLIRDLHIEETDLIQGSYIETVLDKSAGSARTMQVANTLPGAARRRHPQVLPVVPASR